MRVKYREYAILQNLLIKGKMPISDNIKKWTSLTTVPKKQNSRSYVPSRSGHKLSFSMIYYSRIIGRPMRGNNFYLQRRIMEQLQILK